MVSSSLPPGSSPPDPRLAERFLRLCRVGLARRERTLADRAAMLAGELAKRSSSVEPVVRELKVIESYRHHMTTEIAARRPAWQAGYAQLCRHPLVRCHLCGAKSLIVDTHPVLLSDGERAAVIGRFRIVLTPAAGAIHLVNLDGRRGECDHPHVVQGEPTSDQFVHATGERLAAGDLAEAALAALEFLATYDAVEAIRPLMSWPSTGAADV